VRWNAEGFRKMTIRALHGIILAAAMATMTLNLVSCSKEKSGETGGLSGAVIGKVAPPTGKVWADVVTKTPEGGYRMGNPEAAIKLVEYGSLTCSHCAEFSEHASAELRDTFVASGRVNYELRNFVRDAIDLTAATLTRCGTPESYFPLTEQAFKNQAGMMQAVQKVGESSYTAAMALPPEKRSIAMGQLTGLTDFFAARGISRDQANACLANTAEAEALAKRTQEQSEQYKIEGTPTFLVNDQVIGSMLWAELRTKLQTMGAR
jgi:protein-disulfide isomerase